MSNTQRITLASFLAYFVMSGMLAPIGIISGPMAEHFGREVTAVTADFSWLTVGILVGAVIALFAFDRGGLRPWTVALYVLIALSIGAAAGIDSPQAVRLALGAVGVASGLGLAAAALAISLTYTPAKRASALVATDACFSTAGIATAWLATQAVTRGWAWSSAYVAVAGVAVLVAVLAMTTRYPRAVPDDTTPQSGRWPLGVWLCVATLFLYTLGQQSLLFWLPNHLSTVHDVPLGRAGGVVGQFWTGMFVAQLLVTAVVLKTGARPIALLAVLTTTLGAVPLLLVTEIDALLVLALVWGVANLGLLKVVLSFATELVAVPPPRLVSLLLLGATSGTAVAPKLSSTVVEMSNTATVLQFGVGCYAAMALLFYAAALRRTQTPS
ncbi:MAG: MFS transporter [Pseudomonadota bacterium]